MHVYCISRICVCLLLYLRYTLNAIQSTLSREFWNLMLVGDNYPKYVVTLNDLIIGNDFQGIKQMNLLDFLLFDL